TQESRYESNAQQVQQLTQQFLHTASSGDVQGFVKLLAEDVVLVGDSGGRVKGAGLRPVYSRDRVSRGFFGGLQKTPPDRAWIEEVNGQPAIVATLNGKPLGVILLEIRDGQIQTLYSVLNP